MNKLFKLFDFEYSINSVVIKFVDGLDLSSVTHISLCLFSFIQQWAQIKLFLQVWNIISPFLRE